MMKAPSPLIISLFAVAMIYRGFLAFFPALRGENRKKRKPVPKPHGVLYLLAGSSLLAYSLYVIYVFCGGAHRLLPIEDKALFRSADLVLFVPIAVLFLAGLLTGTLTRKKRQKDDGNP